MENGKKNCQKVDLSANILLYSYWNSWVNAESVISIHHFSPPTPTEIVEMTL